MVVVVVATNSGGRRECGRAGVGRETAGRRVRGDGLMGATTGSRANGTERNCLERSRLRARVCGWVKPYLLDRVSVRAGGSGPGLGELVAKSGDAGGKRSRSVGGEAWGLIMAPACGREAHRGGSPRADGAWRGAMESWAGWPARWLG